MTTVRHFLSRLWLGDFSQGFAFWMILIPTLALFKTCVALASLSNLIQNPVLSTRLWLPVLAVIIFALIPLIFICTLRAIWLAKRRFRGGSASYFLFAATLLLLVLAGKYFIQQVPMLKTMAGIALKQEDRELSLAPGIEPNTVILSGALAYDSTKAVKRWFKEHPNTAKLQLALNGGHLHEARQLAHWITRNQLDTEVLQYCFGSCTLVFMGGQRRYAHQNAQIGFHREQDYDNGYRSAWVIERERMADKAFYAARGVLSRYIEPLYYPQPDKGYVVPPMRVLIQANIVTDAHS